MYVHNSKSLTSSFPSLWLSMEVCAANSAVGIRLNSPGEILVMAGPRDRVK